MRRASTTYGAFQYRDFRLLWSGQFGYTAVVWDDGLARNWLAWELTHSASFLGLVNLARAVPMLTLGLVAGVRCDRMDRKRILQAAQSGTLIVVLVMALLLFTAQQRSWNLLVSTFVSGSIMAFNQPARASILPDLVPDSARTNAVSLNQSAMNVSSVLGTALSGLIIGLFTVKGASVMQIALVAVVIVITTRMSVPRAAVEERLSAWASLSAGLRSRRT